MAILVLLTFTFLSILIENINAELYPQYNNIVDINKYVHNISPVRNNQLYNVYQFGNNNPFAESRSGYNFGNNYGGLSNNIPLYTEKKVTTIRKAPVRKQPSKFQKTVPSFKPAQLGGGKWIKPNPGYGKGLPNQVAPINLGKGNNLNPNNFDFSQTVNSFNKQIEQINKAAFEDKFKQDRIPRFNEHSFNQNKAPFDYVPVNLGTKLNNYTPFNFNTDLKINNNELPSIPSGYKGTNILNSNWHQNSVPVNADPVKFATFVPGVDALDASGKILPQNQNALNFESFLSQGKGGDPSSFVQVTNGKVSYTYRIRHLPNKH